LRKRSKLEFLKEKIVGVRLLIIFRLTIMDREKSTHILGLVPGRRVVGFAILDKSGLKDFGVKSLRRHKADSNKMLVINRLLCNIMNCSKPRAVVALKPSLQKSTSFNLQVISFIRGLANSRYCPLYFLSIKQIKKVLGGNKALSNQRQLAQLLKTVYPELAFYLPDLNSSVISDREKYYQPLFAAAGLAYSYLKLSEHEHNKIKEKSEQHCL